LAVSSLSTVAGERNRKEESSLAVIAVMKDDVAGTSIKTLAEMEALVRSHAEEGGAAAIAELKANHDPEAQNRTGAAVIEMF
jgi:hypothetical protein